MQRALCNVQVLQHSCEYMHSCSFKLKLLKNEFAFYMLNRCSGRRWVQHSIGQEALFETKQIYNGHKILIT